MFLSAWVRPISTFTRDPRVACYPRIPMQRSALDWSAIDLVIFDVDGTLYDPKKLQLGMLQQLLRHAWDTRSLQTLAILRTFRRVREALGEIADADFLSLQYAQTAALHRTRPDLVEAMTAEWMETRPLPLLAACRYPGVEDVFAALRASGKKIAVLSDYPAVAKLIALGLSADCIVSATDASIRRLKPDPRGLLSILQSTRTPAQRALMVGDRFDRDGEVALRAGVQALIRSRRPHALFNTFNSFSDPVFKALTPASS
jgi:phosphoglycolate phosphatase